MDNQVHTDVYNMLVEYNRVQHNRFVLYHYVHITDVVNVSTAGAHFVGMVYLYDDYVEFRSSENRQFEIGDPEFFEKLWAELAFASCQQPPFADV